MRVLAWLMLMVIAVVWAAEVPPEKLVTGRPASPAFLHSITGHAVEQPLWPGRTITLPDGSRVSNLPIPLLAPTWVVLSDHPERVAEAGELFDCGLTSWQPVRLQYYHEGAPDKPPHVVGVFLYNPDSRSVRVHVMQTSAGPDRRAVAVGHRATKDFLARLEAREGQLFSVPPGQHVELVSHLLPPLETVTGYIQATVMGPGRLSLHVMSRDEADDPIAFTTLSNPTDTHTRGAFEVSTIRSRRAYICDAPSDWLELGNHAQRNVLDGQPLKGNYGVTYELELDIRNPRSTPRTVGVYFQPRGGGAAGSFLVDGRPVEAGWSKAGVLQKIDTVRLPAGGTVRRRYLTMPEGASNYPVRIQWATIK